MLLPVDADACGGFIATWGDNTYHSVYCDDVRTMEVNKIHWFSTATDAEQWGMKMCKKCDEYHDTSFSPENCNLYFQSSDPLTITIMELSLRHGRSVGEEIGYKTAYSMFYESRYEEGFKAASEEADEKIRIIENSEDNKTLISYCVALVAVGVSVLIVSVGKSHVNDITEKAENEAREIRETALKEVETSRKNFELIKKETRQNHPELAQQIADFEYYLDVGTHNYLISKHRPALRAADELKRIAYEKRTLLSENKQLRYQLGFFETLFPWLEEFKQVPSDEAISYATGIYNSDVDSVRSWISPEEYAKLGSAEKYQLALDRWKNRKTKTDWDVGIEYERYIGYRLECESYKVNYSGAMLGVNDMGRDLIATRPGKTLVIQCKRWAKDKTIHEKHIFQLYGSVAVLSIENPGVRYKGVFITTASLSDVARKCAEFCDIAVVENCPMQDYPLIKCNASKTGEKIYHLPFDQQYDKVIISKNGKSFYAWTTKEAEQKGFRRAYRWRPNKS